MTLVRHALVALLMLSMASPALAQDEPLIGGEETPPTPPPPPQPTPPPPAPVQPAARPAARPAAQPAAPAAEGAMTPRKKKDITDTDHDMVIGDIGLQVVYIHNLNDMKPPTNPTPTPLTQGSSTEAVADQAEKRYSGDSMANLGVRYWFTRRVGLDAGVGLWVHKPRQDDADVGAAFGLYAGVPFALGVYRHLVIFAGPDVGFAFHHEGEDAAGDGINRWLFTLQGKAGIELSLGFIDIPRISLMGTFSFGLRIFGSGDNTEFVLGNDQGFSAESLFSTSIGLIFYI